MSQEKRRLPRFHITPCQFHDSVSGKTFSVQDISLGGLALRLVDREDLPSFAVGTDHQGTIKVEGKKLPARFQVKYIRGTLIGAEWAALDQAFESHLKELSNPIHLGENLKKYDLPEYLSSQWYHNPVGVDLLFYPPTSSGASSTGVGRWTLYIHHSFVQWEMDGGVKTGKALSEDEEGYAHGIVRLETRLIDYDASPDLRLVEVAKILMEHAKLDEPELKTLVLNHLNGVM